MWRTGNSDSWRINTRTTFNGHIIRYIDFAEADLTAFLYNFLKKIQKNLEVNVIYI